MIISTGDELVSPGKPLTPAKIYDSNSFLTEAVLRTWGAVIVDAVMFRDDADALAAYIRANAPDTDLIITTGGVSVGKKDILHDVFSLLSVRRLFWKLDIKPGSPTLAGMYGDVPVICLSGNPFGVFVALHRLVRPVYAHMSGRSDLACHVLHATVRGGFPKASKNTRYVRAHYENGFVTPTAGANSNGVLRTLGGCNCLMEIPAGSPPVKEGDTLWIYLL